MSDGLDEPRSEEEMEHEYEIDQTRGEMKFEQDREALFLQMEINFKRYVENKILQDLVAEGAEHNLGELKRLLRFSELMKSDVCEMIAKYKIYSLQNNI